MSVDIVSVMFRFRYFYPPSEHFFKPATVALLHMAIHVGVYAWFAVACFYTSRWQSRMRFNEYVSVMVFGFLVMSLCEHEIYVALYGGVRDWTHELGLRIDQPSFFYKFSELARYHIDKLQVEERCCGGSASWMWHLIDWVGLEDEGFLPQKVQQRLRGTPWQIYSTSEQVRFVRGLSAADLADMRNRSMAVCTDCPYIKPWSCCDPDSNAHRCRLSRAQLNWTVYESTGMRVINCTVGVYVTEFYDTMVEWGVVAEVMSWTDLLIALLAKYLDSASNEAMLSGFPEGPSRGYLMQRCCGWFCPKPGFMPEQPPAVALTYRAEEAPSGIFGAQEEGLEHQLDEQLDREVERKQEKRQERREELRQKRIDKKVQQHRRNMGRRRRHGQRRGHGRRRRRRDGGRGGQR
ncbi:uncharacterized protein LOC119111670 [Pollicipes pollicipes]|uniref:uncharacterized protein LOC119111670 n=1 Tax=Pollicipes pollicipes TaxID=41117 RepID=UPI0018852EF8|nr:uncharacterized protein LOC119111670 [Pollicipes pollicipes]